MGLPPHGDAATTTGESEHAEQHRTHEIEGMHPLRAHGTSLPFPSAVC